MNLYKNKYLQIKYFIYLLFYFLKIFIRKILVKKLLRNPYGELKHSGRATMSAFCFFALEMYETAFSIFLVFSSWTSICTNDNRNAEKNIEEVKRIKLYIFRNLSIIFYKN